jgi:DNA-binding Lrp family transcriptional regulator
MELDAADRAILALLQEDGRMTNIELAGRVGLSPSAALRRTRNLEKSGVIDRYVALVNPRAVGQGTTVFVEISLENQTDGLLNGFEVAVLGCPEVVSCHLMAGDADYLVQIRCADVEDYERVHREWLSTLPGVARIRSNFALRAVGQRTDLPMG